MEKDQSELRFKAFTVDGLECEVFAIVTNGKPAIQSINVIGDCVVTMDDLDDDTKEHFLSETKRILTSGHHQ